MGIDWGRHYILNEGYIYSGNEKTVTWQAAIKIYGSYDLLPKILLSIINLIVGITNFPNDVKFHYYFPFVGVILIPIICLYCYRQASILYRYSNHFDLILIYLFSMFPLSGLLGVVNGNTGGGAYAKAIFLLLLVLLLKIFESRKKIQLLFFLYSSSFSLYYLLSYMVILSCNIYCFSWNF